MPSSLLNTTSTTSTLGEYVIPFFAPDASQGFSVTNQYWYMENGWESIGATEDKMTFRVQAENVNNYSFDIVLNPDGVLSKIKQDTPVIGVRFYNDSNGDGDYDIIWAGYVETIRQVSADSVQYCEVVCTSVKKCLRDIPVRGSYAWDGQNVVFRDAIPLHLNRGGRPDWTFSDDGIPMPAINADWGLTDDEEPPTSDDQSSTQATYCTLGMLLRYLGIFYSEPDLDESQLAEEARNDAMEFCTGLLRLPSGFPFNFTWPGTFGQEVDQFIISNFNNATGQNNTSQGGARKGRDIRFRNGQPLFSTKTETGVVDTIFGECGGFSYALQYGSFVDVFTPIQITLACVPTRFINGSQSLTLFYAGGKESGNGVLPLIRELDYMESCGGTFTRMIGMGSSVKIEQRIDSKATNGILYGWTNDDFIGFCAEAVEFGGGSADEESMARALKKYPHLFSRFLFDPAFDFSAGTDYEQNPATQSVRPVWPFLLSYQGAALTTQANDIVPYPLRIEIDNGDGSGFREPGYEQDGFISWDNGYFEFNAFREIGINRQDTPSVSKRYGMFTWGTGNDNGVPDGAWGGIKNGSLNITLNNIRCTVAIPHDATLNYSMKVPADTLPVGSEELFQAAPDSPDALKFDFNFSRTMVVDLTRLYDLWLRIFAFPIPESSGGTQFPDKLSITDAVRSDYNLLAQNVNKMLYERNRLERSGFFRLIGPLLPPQAYALGSQISQIKSTDPSSNVNPYVLNCCIQRREWRTIKAGSGSEPKWTSETDLCPI